MRHRFRDVSGFVLAGGASRRMGRPKHHLKLGGETVLMRQVRLLRTVCSSVAILVSPENLMNTALPTIPVVRDLMPHCGPLGGIYTGLCVTRTEYNLFLGCDLPLMQARFLRLLCRRAIEAGSHVTVPVSGPGNYQPLCAVYRRKARPTIRASILRGDYKVTRFFRRVICQPVSLKEIRDMGFDPRIFTNVNTPAEYEAVVSGQ
jgi:molybdopterin-guanine dinucleotide biosynthesis protein A